MKEQLSKNLREFLEETIKYELKWMYHYDVDHIAFGVETDKYRWCQNVLNGIASIQNLLDYFTKYYPNDEKHFISRIKELM